MGGPWVQQEGVEGGVQDQVHSGLVRVQGRLHACLGHDRVHAGQGLVALAPGQWLDHAWGLYAVQLLDSCNANELVTGAMAQRKNSLFHNYMPCTADNCWAIHAQHKIAAWYAYQMMLHLMLPVATLCCNLLSCLY